MVGEVTMRETRYWKPNMNNLRGKKGREIMAQLRNMQKPSTHELEQEANAYMEKILARRQNEKTTRE